MPIRIPVFAIPRGLVAPPGYPNFIGFRGTSKVVGASVLAGGDPTQLLGGRELGCGLYVTANKKEATLYAAGHEGNNRPGLVLRVFCNAALAADEGEICDPAQHQDPTKINDPPIIPPDLLTLPFLQDKNIPDQIKIAPARITDLAFK
jgi:hypothetical protein